MKKWLIILFLGIVSYLSLYIIGDSITFNEEYAQLVFADSEIINGSVSADDQWRMQCESVMPETLATCLRLFEDEYFYFHFGVNPVSIIKAFIDNRKAGKIVRGGSTLTMQLARIACGNKSRIYKQKFKEVLIAFSLEARYNKKEILNLYGQHAPFGGNTIGYCAAARRYYNKDVNKLSWSEAATLAVLPNAPSQIYPGKGQEKLIAKRNVLLKKLLKNDFIDSTTYRLSLMESLPTQSRNFKNLAPHLMEEVKLNYETNFNFNSTLDYSLQENVSRVVDAYNKRYKSFGIDNASVLVVRNDGSIASYVGNISCRENNCGHAVNMITSPRSPGSTLKPFLYAMALDEGLIGPTTLLQDIPVWFNGYTPSNFDKKFRGVINATDALTSSLNIPAINLLSDFGVEPFIDNLKMMGFEKTDKSADHYGLSIILGGGEVTPLELGNAYCNLARVAQGLDPIEVSYDNDIDRKIVFTHFPISKASAWITLEMLKGVNRPSSQDGWQFFENQKEISWKTGTSFGFRDAWSVGVTKEYTVVVWVGNADGEGKPGLTGVKKAAPLMFSVFDLLPNAKLITPPYRDMDYKYLCKESGLKRGPHCNSKKGVYLPKSNSHLGVCSYHKKIPLNKEGTKMVNHECYNPSEIVFEDRFILEPITNNYYKTFTGTDFSLPEFDMQCYTSTNDFTIIYPTLDAKIKLPKDLDLKMNSLIAKATATSSDSLFWFLNAELIGVTKEVHSMKLTTTLGENSLTIVSNDGSEKSLQFYVME